MLLDAERPRGFYAALGTVLNRSTWSDFDVTTAVLVVGLFDDSDEVTAPNLSFS